MSLDDLVVAASERLSERRLEHVRAVAQTAAEIARCGEWPIDFETRVVRASAGETQCDPHFIA